MSGGVDSSVAALLLKERGYQVAGASLLMFETEKGGDGQNSCCSLQGIAQAARTAKILGIPHSMIDARDLFIEKVIEPFAAAYAKGLTPNPCILCNRHVKIPLLIEAADRMSADFIATGHYARIGRKENTAVLQAAADGKKDQSYVLYAQRKEDLQRFLLPLGDFTKPEVRRLARKAGLPVFDRPESQEICFARGNEYIEMVKALAPGCPSEGPILDDAGRRIGTHCGISGYTIGQRKRLGIKTAPGGPAPKPWYVYRIDAPANAVYAGRREKVLGRHLETEDMNWLLEGHRRMDSFLAGVKVRSMARPAPALVRPSGPSSATVKFEEPQWAPAPGQSAVFYSCDVPGQGQTVIGGGVIKAWK